MIEPLQSPVSGYTDASIDISEQSSESLSLSVDLLSFSKSPWDDYCLSLSLNYLIWNNNSNYSFNSLRNKYSLYIFILLFKII